MIGHLAFEPQEGSGPGYAVIHRRPVIIEDFSTESRFRFPLAIHERGIGLGLTLSRNLVEANGGRIEVESEVGKGSTFTVWLPVGSEE